MYRDELKGNLYVNTYTFLLLWNVPGCSIDWLLIHKCFFFRWQEQFLPIEIKTGTIFICVGVVQKYIDAPDRKDTPHTFSASRAEFLFWFLNSTLLRSRQLDDSLAPRLPGPFILMHTFFLAITMSMSYEQESTFPCRQRFCEQTWMDPLKHGSSHALLAKYSPLFLSLIVFNYELSLPAYVFTPDKRNCNLSPIFLSPSFQKKRASQRS